MTDDQKDKSLLIATQEYDDNIAMGVEQETTSTEGRNAVEPWNPDQIRVDPKMFSLRNLMDMIDDSELNLAPEFQRNQVWTPEQKSRLIESLLLRIPLPAFYFDSSKDGKMQVVDGLQRLSTIHQYVRHKEFALTGLEYLGDQVGGQRFDELIPSWTRRIYQAQLVVNVIDPQTPVQVKFNIFKRINTGGKPLNAQEIRHAMGTQRARNFLKQLAAMKVFKEATGGILADHKRMADREVVLRFCAFRQHLAEYSTKDSLDTFLTEFNAELEELPAKEGDALRDAFERAMENASGIFGEFAFRKWPQGEGRRNPINRALFESWAVALADYEWAQLAPFKDKIAAWARQVMTEDDAYLRSVSVSTGDHRNVERRFAVARQIVESSLE
jgi:hypothetical protein